MGWFHDSAPEHEGFIVALERVGHSEWREVTYEAMREIVEAGDRRLRFPSHVQSACECGWRSPRLAAPFGTRWSPYSVEVPPDFRDACAERWRTHIDVDVLMGAAPLEASRQRR